MMNFIQGEGWTQDLRLTKDGKPLPVGPLEVAERTVRSIETVIKVNGRLQARFRWPYDEENYPYHEFLEVDLFDANVIRMKISRNMSRRFEPGYLTVFTYVDYLDGRRETVVQIIGNLLRADLAVRMTG